MGPALLVDKQTYIFKQCRDILRRQGIPFVGALSTEEALAYLQSFEVSVVITNHLGDELDAFELLQAAKLYRPFVRGILCVQTLGDLEMMRAVQVGYDEVLFPPFQNDAHLAACVRHGMQVCKNWHKRYDELQSPQSNLFWRASGFAERARKRRAAALDERTEALDTTIRVRANDAALERKEPQSGPYVSIGPATEY